MFKTKLAIAIAVLMLPVSCSAATYIYEKYPAIEYIYEYLNVEYYKELGDAIASYDDELRPAMILVSFSVENPASIKICGPDFDGITRYYFWNDIEPRAIRQIAYDFCSHWYDLKEITDIHGVSLCLDIHYGNWGGEQMHHYVFDIRDANEFCRMYENGF